MSEIYFLGLEDQAGLDRLLEMRQDNERRSALLFENEQVPAFWDSSVPNIRRADTCGQMFEAVRVNNDTFVLTVGGNAFGAK